MPGTTSTEILERFRRDYARGHKGDIDLTLRPAYLELLAKLGGPQNKLPPVFHVAGTNGKGSVCAFLRAMLEAAGYRVHVYTSPHLVRFHERIRVAGELIGEKELADILNECQSVAAPGDITYFEAATVAAFTAFARHPADFTILEVGLGGRLDATNVIDKPLAGIITRISYDHRDYLGDGIEGIAWEKAGIMRAGVPCFSAPQPNAEVYKTLREAARAVGAPLFIGGENWSVEKRAHGFCYIDTERELELPLPKLVGEHQLWNAGLAIAALQGSGVRSQASGFLSFDRAISQGLKSVEWPARLQKIETGMLYDLIPHGWELWLDGGHNDSAGEVLAQQAKAWHGQDARPLHLICGMLTTKNPREFLAPLAPAIASMHAVAIKGESLSFTSEQLAIEARATGIKNAAAASSIEQVLKFISQKHIDRGRILICGSLYLAGNVLRMNET